MNVKGLVIFVLGAGLGSLVTWKLVKTKYEMIAEEEIRSVKEVFAKKAEKEDEEEPEDRFAPEQMVQTEMHLNDKPELEEYAKILKESNYKNYSKVSAPEENKEEEEECMAKERPYVIPPDQFGEYDDYKAETLNYYADGILTDDWDEIIPDEEVDELVGKASLNCFGEYENDSVFVRNDAKKSDYEILRDSSNFTDRYDSEDSENE